MKVRGYKIYYFSILPCIDIYNRQIWLEWLRWAVSIEF